MYCLIRRRENLTLVERRPANAPRAAQRAANGHAAAHSCVTGPARYPERLERPGAALSALVRRRNVAGRARRRGLARWLRRWNGAVGVADTAGGAERTRHTGGRPAAHGLPS